MVGHTRNVGAGDVSVDGEGGGIEGGGRLMVREG